MVLAVLLMVLVRAIRRLSSSGNYRTVLSSLLIELGDGARDVNALSQMFPHTLQQR